MTRICAPTVGEPQRAEATAFDRVSAATAPIDLVDARCELDALLDQVQQLTFDAGEWASLSATAAEQTRRLATQGALPSHLVVDPEDPSVVVERSLVALSRHLDRLYAAP